MPVLKDIHFAVINLHKRLAELLSVSGDLVLCCLLSRGIHLVYAYAYWAVEHA